MQEGPAAWIGAGAGLVAAAAACWLVGRDLLAAWAERPRLNAWFEEAAARLTIQQVDQPSGDWMIATLSIESPPGALVKPDGADVPVSVDTPPQQWIIRAGGVRGWGVKFRDSEAPGVRKPLVVALIVRHRRGRSVRLKLVADMHP